MAVAGTKDLVSIGEAYVNFVHQVGQRPDLSFEETISTLFAKTCCVNINGQIVDMATEEARKTILDKMRSAYGKWYTQLMLVAESTNSSVVLKFVSLTDNTTRFLALAILNIEEGLIVKIDHIHCSADKICLGKEEIYSRVKPRTVYANEGLALLGHRYLQFLHRAGQAADITAIASDVFKLCAPTCTKIVNGEVVFSLNTQFAPQLMQAHEKYGKWQVHEDEHVRVLPAESKGCVVVKYMARTDDKNTQLLAMAVLQVVGGLITGIDEVYQDVSESKEVTV